MNNDYQNTQNDMDIESMRQQMNTLKKKLNEQEILNDHIMRRSMKKEVGNITKRYNIIIAIAVLMVPYGYWCFVKLSGFSVIFWIVTSIFMLICAGATFYNSRKISDPGLMNRNLVEAGKKVASAKKFESNWLLVGIPAVILWVGWFLYESYLLHGGAIGNGIFLGGCIGAIIGAICGTNIHMKTQRQYQEIISQIEDLTAGK
jgi:hypothetical protein